ncbi:MAG TPA: hypothetical protein VH583_18275 [Vicinamibacterales bacterium]|jgi:hypothetical protein
MRQSLLSLLVVLAAAQPGAQSRLDTEVERVRRQIGASVPADQQAALVQRLGRAEVALKAGRTYQAAYLLEAPYDGAAAFAFAASSGIKSPEAFLEKWNGLGPPKPRSGSSARIAAVIDALAEVSEDRGRATYQASRPYGQDSDVESGLYYLGESYAAMDFAAFLRSGSWPAAGSRPAFRSIASELATFDREMTTKYETMEPANHPTYIRASAALKQARSLNDHGAFEGALFEYLLSRYLFAPLRGSADAASRERIDSARASLPAGEDHSIAELFLQFAEEGLSSDNADLRSNAAFVSADVVPAYLAALTTSRASTMSDTTAAVTITLVRWPFT